MEAASTRSDLSWQHGGESCLLVAQRGRRMAAVHGDWRSLHWGNRKCKPKMGTINNSYKSFLWVKAPVSPEKVSTDQLSTCLQHRWAARASPQCCGWPLSQRDSQTSSHICFATARTNSCFGPSDPTPPESSGRLARDVDQGEKSENPKPPDHTWALPHSGSRWLEWWSPVGSRAAVYGYLPAMTVE